MIRLAVNVRRLIPGKIGGQENAFRAVFDVLLRRYRDEFDVTLLTSFLSEKSFGDWEGLVRLHSVSEEKEAGSLAAVLEDHDVLYCPLLFLEPELPPIPSVVTIPDLQHEALPELFPEEILASRIRGVRAGATRAHRVLTVSEYSRQHLLRCFHLPEQHVVVTPLDCADRFNEPADSDHLAALRKRVDLPKTYVLFPANNWPHKNHRGLFRGISEYRARFGTAPHVILTGAQIEGRDLREEAAAAGVTDLVRHLGFVDDADMPSLYDGAACLVFVSLFEGFGIPVVEAMRRGTPVIASNRTSLPEVVGDHGLLVDPEDPTAIAERLHRVLDRPEETRARADKARDWSRRFSAASAAEKTAGVLRAVAAESRATPARPACRADARPKVLVVTPSFNQGDFVRDTIDSVLMQDYDNLEYFVADGGSTDDSVSILKSYGDRVRWVSEPDGGQAAAIAAAWRESDAEIVAWLNSDDTYLPGAVSTGVQYLLDHPEISMVYGNAWYTDREGQRTEPYPAKPFDADALRGDCFICQPATFIRRDVFRVIDFPDPDLRFCMDYDLWIRLSNRFLVGHTEDFLATSRMYKENKTLGERDAFYREIFSVVRRHYGSVHRTWSRGHNYHRARQVAERVFWRLPASLQRLIHAAFLRYRRSPRQRT